MNYNNLLKRLQLIIKNRDTIISEQSIFNKETFMLIYAILNGHPMANLSLSDEQQNIIIEAFINSKKAFNKHTPSFIIDDSECLRLAIARDINSVNYLNNRILDSDLKKYILNEALKQELVLTDKCPTFLKQNYQIAYNSLKKNINSADYIDWSSLPENEIQILVEKLVNDNYSLSENSPTFLTENVDLALANLKNNKSALNYISSNLKYHPVIFEYLMIHEDAISESELIRQKLELFTNPQVLQRTFQKLDLFKCSEPQYAQRFTKLYSDAINNAPLIKDFEPVFHYLAENVWNNYRHEYFDYYDNILGKICAELRNNSDLTQAISNLRFLEEMEQILGVKYSQLIEAITEYYHIYHSDDEFKLAKIESSQNIIASLAALYVSKSKDNYIKEQLEALYSHISECYTIKMDHPYVYKRLILSSKKAQFEADYRNNEPEVCEFIDNLVKKYSQDLNPDSIRWIIDGFLLLDSSKADSYFSLPRYFSEYVRYEKAIKLIRRLNSGFISYDGVEVHNYLDIITYDEHTHTYIYTGRQFTETDLSNFSKYRQNISIFEKIKKELMLKINSLNFDGKISNYEITKLSEELPFTDEYFEFNKDIALSDFTIRDLMWFAMDSRCGFDKKVLLNDELYEKNYDLLVNKRLIWLLLLTHYNSSQEIIELGINPNNIIEIVNNMHTLVKLSKEFNFDLNKIGELLQVHEISKYTNAESLAVLGKNIIGKLCKYQEYTTADSSSIIAKAQELICQMVKRHNSTVPYIQGSFLNYHYSMYDSQDTDILTSGIDTDACFRIDGNDNDFLHYCALDKNGFVIKITDEQGNFIARAAGFRHGNCVFINQLRTIYDLGGTGYTGEYANERRDIVKAFKQACYDIVKTSQANTNEHTKIDYVFVTKSYALKNFKSNVSGSVAAEIGLIPMDTESDDWYQFIKNTANLEESPMYNYFKTDYGNYSLICTASIKPASEITPDDIIRADVPALYERPRSPITIASASEPIAYQKTNKINAINSCQEEIEFTSLEVPANSLIITGDNWYQVFHQGKIIASCLLAFDKQAENEFHLVKQILLNKSTDICSNLEQLINEINIQNPEQKTKVLKKIPSES